MCAPSVFQDLTLRPQWYYHHRARVAAWAELGRGAGVPPAVVGPQGLAFVRVAEFDRAIALRRPAAAAVDHRVPDLGGAMPPTAIRSRL